MTRALVYTRVSTDDQAKDGYSLGAQEQLCRDRAEQDGMHVAEVYCDDGYSGATLERPALQRMLKELQPGDVIYLYRLDRLSRDVEAMFGLVRRFQKTKVTLRPLVGSADVTNSLGRAFVGVQSVFAQLEREQIAERVSMGMQKRVAGGKRYSRPPYGYRSDVAEWAIDEEAAEVVRTAVDLRLQGLGYGSICQRLEQSGRMAPGGNRWHSRQVYHILHNPLYAGDLHFGQVEQTDVVPAIVDRATWDRLQLLNDARRKARSRSDSVYLLSGLVFCECGRSMGGYVARPFKRKDGTYTRLETYNCVGRRAQPGTDHVNSVTAHLLDELVLSHLDSLTDSSNVVLTLPPPRKHPSVTARLSAIDQELDNLERALLAGRITDERYDRHKDRLDIERAELLARDEQPADDKQARQALRQKYGENIGDLIKQYDKLGPTSAIKAAVQMRIGRIEISRPDGTRRGLDSRTVQIYLRTSD